MGVGVEILVSPTAHVDSVTMPCELMNFGIRGIVHQLSRAVYEGCTENLSKSYILQIAVEYESFPRVTA